MRQTARLILSEHEGSRILARETARGLALPVVTVEERWLRAAPDLNAAVHEQLEITVTVLRCEGIVRLNQRSMETLFVLENHSPLWQPSGSYRWCDRGDVERLRGVAERRAALRWFDEGDALEKRRMPWERRGWYEAAAGWASEVLRRHGRSVVAPPQQFKHWTFSSILRIATDGGDAWLKAVPPFFAVEGDAIRALGSTFPGRVPAVIEADHALGRTLYDALPQTTLRQVNGDAVHREAVRLLAQMQIAMTSRAGELLAIGAADRRLERLAGDARWLLAQDGVRASLEAGDLTQFDAFVESIPGRVAELAACGIPETLVHGDFHPGNVAIDENGGLVIFDWTDVSVSHPFFDMATYVTDETDVREAPSATIIEAYASEWASAVDRADIEQALRLAKPLAQLHHAISYWRLISGIDVTARWELGGAEGGWLRRLLAAI